MSEYQEVIFKFIDEKGKQLGDLELRAKYPGPTQGKVDEGLISCYNVPQINTPTDIFPIEYCKLNPLQGLSRIMLLEETSYDVKFKAKGEKIDGFLQEIYESVFSQNLFNESKKSGIES